MPGVPTVITREFYDSLTIHFRECPGNASLVARRALCDRRTAGKAWSTGWPKLGLRPIRDLLEDEKISVAAEARARAIRAQEAQEAERERARAEHVEAAAQERQLLKVARGDVLSALVVAAEIVPAMRACAKAIVEGLKPDPATGAATIAPAAAMSLLHRHAQMVQRAVGAAEAIVQLSRLDRGETTAHVAVTPGADITYEEAVAELEGLTEVLQAAKRTVPGLPPKPDAIP